MNDAPDEIDRMLREYAPRWRAAQPAPPAVDLARLATQRPAGRRARWIPVVAVAAAVIALAAGIGFARSYLPAPSRPPVTATPSPVTTTSSPGVVPWAPLPPSGARVPTTTLPGSPDPALAEGLPPCRAENLHVTSQMGAAAGTRGIAVTITSTSRCRLGGYPSVTALSRTGRTLAVPVERDESTGQYTHPFAVASDSPAKLQLWWSSGWCAAEIDIAKLRLDLPDGGGALTIEGFGPSACFGTPGSGEKAPIRVGRFTPPDFTPDQVVSVFNGVSARIIAPESVTAGERLRFTVVLTAPAGRDIALDPCPDYTISVYVNGPTEASYALNCATVPYRDAAGRPYLPAGTPVRFEMAAETPRVPAAGAKLGWSLDVSDSFSANVHANTLVEIR